MFVFIKTHIAEAENLVIKMISIIGAAATASTLAMAYPISAFASVRHQLSQKEIDLNGQSVSKPSGFTFNNTAYMPIWYVMSALKHLGIQSEWDGVNWHITTPGSEQPDLTGFSVGSGSMNIYINSKLAKRVIGISDIDPASKKQTMFMPVWYVMQILQTIGVAPTWDGSKWDMETYNNLTDYAPEDIIQLVDQYTTELNATDDPVQFTNDLYQSGFVTSNLVSETEQAFKSQTFAQWAAKENVTKESFNNSSFKITQEGEYSPSKLVIEASETDTYTFSNNSTQTITQVNDWIVTKDAASALWQVDEIYPVSQTALKGMDGTVIDPGFTNNSLFSNSSTTSNSTGTSGTTGTTTTTNGK